MDFVALFRAKKEIVIVGVFSFIHHLNVSVC